ncbi:O-antigen ligase family protein [Flavobacterium sp. LS1R47]|uniref:O-antigen ligase family protein n=1 Tax=Flavobacterium frigoritolerans TaxID=2987686 RepID=A0A9X2ZKR8_9FLAO|nr:O-antigen ligase family protein [Flavobacterium frigoritolerans]MCV9931230.1 O-antigen ligase family protein [Flavobacterium frigoritolerans]
MKNNLLSYGNILLIHALIALAIFVMPFLSKIYALIIPILGLLFVLKTKNKNNEVLLIAAYLVGVEVFLRMTGGNLNNEYIKLSVIFFMLLGMIYSSFTISSFVYWFFLILLIPSILVTATTDILSVDVKKALFFNLSGPFCLAFCAIYTFNRKISFSELQNIVLAMGLPIVSTTAYLFLYNPSVQSVVTGTQSNFETSGGFGPNQVSTILGLGMFVFFTQLILFSKSKKMLILNGILLLVISYRAIVTFSRGGVITGVVMIAILLLLLYFHSSREVKGKLAMVFVITAIMGIGIWTYTSVQTSGLIEKRYANQDATGRVKKDRLGGREAIIEVELKTFFDNPILGVGAGLGKEYRKKAFGVDVASHNEITRMISEHGFLGILGLLILFIMPFVLYYINRSNLYFLSFYVFWFLTINHAAMRTAAPAFVYALTLISVINYKTDNYVKTNTIPD